ncbi:MAG: hypothetical protein AAFY56_17675, partial [Pseudomonadota bacterium]
MSVNRLFSGLARVTCALLVLTMVSEGWAQDNPRSRMTRVPDENTPFASNMGPVYFNWRTEEQSYFNIRLTAFDIGRDQRLWRNYEPAVVVNIEVGGEQYTRLLGSGNVSASNDRIRSRQNESIVGPFPYLGGDMKLELKVFQASVKDNLKDTLDNLSVVAGAVGYTDIEKFAAVSAPIKRILDGWFADQQYAAISFASTWVPKSDQGGVQYPFREGYYVIHALDVELDPSKIRIPAEGPPEYDGKIMSLAEVDGKRFDFAIFEFNHTIERTNVQQRPFYGKFEEAKSAAEFGNAVRMEQLFADAMAILSTDRAFTDYDRRVTWTRLYAQIAREVKRRVPEFQAKPVPLLSYSDAATS